jgi:hypothetical protein
VWVFPKLVICLHCGLAEFTVPEGELHLLAQDISAAPRVGTEINS